MPILVNKDPKIPPIIPRTTAPQMWDSGTEISVSVPNFKVPVAFSSKSVHPSSVTCDQKEIVKVLTELQKNDLQSILKSQKVVYFESS